MRIAVGSDEKTSLTDITIDYLRAKGFDVELYGALTGVEPDWPDVARNVAEKVASGACEEGILFCWTGTGVSMAANKVPGIRAALCPDPMTAKGARYWNHANVLAIGIERTSAGLAREILDAWFEANPQQDNDPTELVNKLEALERKYLKI